MVRLLLVVALLAVPRVAAAEVAPAEPVPAAASPGPAPAVPAPSTVASPAPVAAPAPAAPRVDPLFDSPSPEMPGEGTGYLLFKTLVVLGLVVAIIYLTLNVGVRKLLRLSPQAGALVKVVDRVALEPKKSVLVVQVGGEFLLLGSSESSLSFLTKLDGPGVERVLAERVQQPPSSGFLDRLNALARKEK
jgi:flagellar protein FliO/FliZ